MSFKPEAKPYKKSDEKGLFVLVNPNGSIYWRFKYRFLGKEKSLALGTFPDVLIASAREKRGLSQIRGHFIKHIIL